MQEDFRKLDRGVKACLRMIATSRLSREDKKHVEACKKALSVLRLDIRDYEYAETRLEQLKWAKIADNNLRALEQHMLALSEYFGPVDIAELSAHIDLLKSKID